MKKNTTTKKRLDVTSGLGSSTSPLHGIPAIELYQKESCPFSHSVRTRLSQLGLDFIAHNVSGAGPEAQLKRKQLIEAGGKDQIPFLVDRRTGVSLYDSDAIIAYLENEYGEVPEGPILKAAKKLRSQVQARGDRVAWIAKKPVSLLASVRTDLHEGWETLKGTGRLFLQFAKPSASSNATKASASAKRHERERHRHEEREQEKRGREENRQEARHREEHHPDEAPRAKAG